MKKISIGKLVYSIKVALRMGELSPAKHYGPVLKKTFIRFVAACCLLSVLCGPTTAENWSTYRCSISHNPVTSETLGPELFAQWKYMPRRAPKPAWPMPAEELPRMHSDRAYHAVVADGTTKTLSLAGKNDRYGRAGWQEFGAVVFKQGTKLRLSPAAEGLSAVDLLRLVALSASDLGRLVPSSNALAYYNVVFGFGNTPGEKNVYAGADSSSGSCPVVSAVKTSLQPRISRLGSALCKTQKRPERVGSFLSLKAA